MRREVRFITHQQRCSARCAPCTEMHNAITATHRGMIVRALTLATAAKSTFREFKQIALSACGSHSKYNPSLSSTYKDLKKSFKGSYVSGGVSGRLVQDAVAIGGLGVKKQGFGSVGGVSSDWMEDHQQPLIFSFLFYKKVLSFIICYTMLLGHTCDSTLWKQSPKLLAIFMTKK